LELRDYLVKKYRVSPEKILIVKNGVETDRFRPNAADLSLRNALGIPSGARVVVFTNPRLHTFPTNEMALRSFFKMIPAIERRVPSIRFLILGGGPALESPSKNVIYTGFVEDLAAHINLADVCVAPFPREAVCGGTRNKVCEYLASGKPLVATREAMRGFEDAVEGKHFLLGEEAEDFVYKIVYCLHNQDAATQIGQNARLLSARYDWGYLTRQLRALLEEVAGSWT
jgi:glycosyltransferase involved in cell wall biosynthesis